MRAIEPRASAERGAAIAHDVVHQLFFGQFPRYASKEQRELRRQIGPRVVHGRRRHEEDACAAAQIGEERVAARRRRAKAMGLIDDHECWIGDGA